MSRVVACLDGSVSTPAVCDYAAWASLRSATPLNFLHVLDPHQDWVASDLDGPLGWDERLEESQGILAAATARVLFRGIDRPESWQRRGKLVEVLHGLEADIALLVMGIRGENTAQIGSHVANVVRTLPRPILVTPSTFTAPESFMIAFDGSMRLSQGVAMLANSPLFKGLPAHLVMVGAETAEAWAMLDAAGATLSAAGHRTSLTLLPGEVVPALTAYQASQGIDVLVMGVYGHSRIRQFLHGSTTTTLLRTASAPLLLLH